MRKFQSLGEEAWSKDAFNHANVMLTAQCDPDGNQYVLLDSLVDHRRLDTAIRPADQKVVRPDGRTYMKRNTIGW